MIYNIDLGGGKQLSFELGRYAKQANGSVMVRMGDTMVLVTACADTKAKPKGVNLANPQRDSHLYKIFMNQ